MKFGALLDLALEQGFDSIATGHYCRRLLGHNGVAQLWEGADKNKDQSYFLARITQFQLDHARFPLGEVVKGQVPNCETALPVAEKRQPRHLLLGKFRSSLPPSLMTNRGNYTRRTSAGLHRLSLHLGQRRGIGVPSNQDHENYVVTGKDEKSNQLIVAFENPDEPTLWARSYLIESLSFMDSQNLTESKRMLGKTRYRDPSVRLELIPREDEFWEVVFDEPQRALTPGQTLALYEGERLVGSAVVRQGIPRESKPFSLIIALSNRFVVSYAPSLIKEL